MGFHFTEEKEILSKRFGDYCKEDLAPSFQKRRANPPLLKDERDIPVAVSSWASGERKPGLRNKLARGFLF